jgi:hypothetical protein
MSYFGLNADLGNSTEREIKISTIKNFRAVIGKFLSNDSMELRNSKKREAEVYLNEEEFQISQKRLKMI